MEWMRLLTIWRTFRMFLLSLVTGLGLFIYALTQGSLFWLVVGLIWMVATAIIFKKRWKSLKFQIRLLLTDE